MSVIPDAVKSFLSSFAQALRDPASTGFSGITHLYDQQWSKLTDKYYKQSEWPTSSAIAEIVQNDSIFLMLYDLLYYHHHYVKLFASLNLETRVGAFKAYCKLFDWLLSQTQPPELELPNLWIWDLVDEFIYQYQEFSQYIYKLLRDKQKQSSASEELAQIKANPEWWSVHTVLRYLQDLVAKSKILDFLHSGTAMVTDGKTIETTALYRNFGYFSLIGLLRMHCLMGDYYSASKILSHISLNKQGLHNKVIACNVTLFYYAGFVYMMTRNFPDAIRTFQRILKYVNGMPQFHTKAYQQEAISRKSEHMYALLAILLSFCPQKVEEEIVSVLRDNYADKMASLARGDLSPLEELFLFGSPKFTSPVRPNLDDEAPTHLNLELSLQQFKVFANEISQQSMVPVIRSYLKLYTTIGIDKLANLLERKVDADTLKKVLLCFAHKTRVISGSDAAVRNSSDISLYVDDNMIHITDTKVQPRFADYFIRKANAFDEIATELQAAQ